MIDEHFRDLREKWVIAQNTGNFVNISTQEMKELVDMLRKAEDVLLMFPECASTRFWCCMQRIPLEGYIKARQRK